MSKVEQTILLETDNLLLIELYNYPEIPTPLVAMQALEKIEAVKQKLTDEYESIEVFVSKKGAFRQIIKIKKR